MSVFDDYAFVVGGRTRKEVFRLLDCYRTPSEIAKMLKVHGNVVTRVLRDLVARDLVGSSVILARKKTFWLTKKGELAWQVLENLAEPRTFSQVNRCLNADSAVTRPLIRDLVKHGFVTFMRASGPTRNFYRITPRGKAVRENLK
jgi:DNA-binding MarR family transcriptional regulator